MIIVSVILVQKAQTERTEWTELYGIKLAECRTELEVCFLFTVHLMQLNCTEMRFLFISVDLYSS